MQRVVFVLLCLLSLLAFSACGSNDIDSERDYPVMIGDSYDDVYKYCEENAVGEVNSTDEAFASIWADLDWFGDGDIYEVWFNDINKYSGVENIAFNVDTDNDNYQKDGEILIEKLKKIHGDPIGNPNPTFSHDETEIHWIDGDLSIGIYILTDYDYKPDTFRVSYREADETTSNYNSESDSDYDDWDTDDNGEADWHDVDTDNDGNVSEDEMNDYLDDWEKEENDESNENSGNSIGGVVPIE